MIETAYYLWLLERLSPWHIYNIMKSRIVPILIFATTTWYAMTGNSLSSSTFGMDIRTTMSTLLGVEHSSSSTTAIMTDTTTKATAAIPLSIDLFTALALQLLFVIHFGPESESGYDLDCDIRTDIIFIVPSIIWFFIMQPGIFVWSLLTIRDCSWGNLPRSISWAGATTPIAGTCLSAPLSVNAGNTFKLHGNFFDMEQIRSEVQIQQKQAAKCLWSAFLDLWKYLGFQMLWLSVVAVAMTRYLLIPFLASSSRFISIPPSMVLLVAALLPIAVLHIATLSPRSLRAGNLAAAH